MFNIEFLHVIREFECQDIVKRLSPGVRILEIGGGTGRQARRLTELGYEIQSIDMPDSNYAAMLEFAVQPYDGRHIPFPDASFDVVFSSNVLEHVLDLPLLHREMKRVLKPGGYCVHLMPTGSWRFWTSVAHYVEFAQRLFCMLPQLFPRGVSGQELLEPLRVLRRMAGMARRYASVPRHGETGTALSEIGSFSRRRWMQHFLSQGFKLDEASPMGLFYTGYMILGDALSLNARKKLARWLGSACAIYVVRPL